MKIICRKNRINQLRFYNTNLRGLKYASCLLCLFISFAVKAQPTNKPLIDTYKADQLVTINRADYKLQCPITWRVDSAGSLLTVTPRLMWKDSITVSIHSFQIKVLPFKSFMKNPLVDYDAKTTITASNDMMIYKVTAIEQCDTCHNQNKRREQYYNVFSNKVYILYFTASNKLLKKFKDDLDLIFKSFELKY